MQKRALWCPYRAASYTARFATNVWLCCAALLKNSNACARWNASRTSTRSTSARCVTPTATRAASASAQAMPTRRYSSKHRLRVRGRPRWPHRWQPPSRTNKPKRLSREFLFLPLPRQKNAASAVCLTITRTIFLRRLAASPYPQ